MTWVVIGIVLMLFSGCGGVVYGVLFYPWRFRPVHRFLYPRSRLYRRWCWHRTLVMMRKVAASIAGLVAPAKRAAAAMEKFGETLRKAGLVDA